MGHGKSKLPGLRNHVLRCRNSKALMRVLSLEGEDFDVNTPVTTENEKATLLWIAVRCNDLAVVRHLIGLGADVSQPCGALHMTPLHLAAHNHNVEVAAVLLEAGANPNVLDRWNYTPIMYAAIHHEPDLVEQFFRVFLHHNCDPNFGACLNEKGMIEQPDSNTDLVELDSGYSSNYITYVREPMGPVSGTALHLAIQNPHLPNETVQILISGGASPDKQNLYGQSALMGAILDIYYDYHTNVKGHIELLINQGADVNIRDKRGWTSMHYATQRGSISCMQQLMRTGVDSDTLGLMGESPLWLLLILGWREAAKFLIENGCDMNRPVKSSVILFINQNADVCRYGSIFPIEFAICNRYYNLAERMIACGVRVDDDMWLGGHVDLPNPRHAEFREFLATYRTERSRVRPLLEYCRDVIRRVMKQSICLKTEQLYLPQALKDYVTCTDI